MTYRGYTIQMCRMQCETWSLTDDGEANEYLADCYVHTDTPPVTFRLIDEADGLERIVGSGHDLEGVKKYADALALGLPA